jgi:peptidoglycan/xylan/chitin deacetylase (PgdA/CDA1 family)
VTPPVPGDAPSALLVSHDVDAPDAFREGPWGKPGALQIAELERREGLRATFNITTDYVVGYYYEPTVHALCDLGMCPLGAHSVTHPLTFGKLPVGSCGETVETYGKQPSLCGEIRVSRDLVAQATTIVPRVWRSPYLELAPKLFDLLAKAGFAYDSGFGIGDLPYNTPVDLATVGFHQNRFEHAPLLEFPVSCEDGLREVHDGVEQRAELQSSNRKEFESLWRYIVLRNAQNRSHTTLLLHPSTGRGMPPENVRTKVEVLAHLIDQAKAAGVVPMAIDEMGDFWRARSDAGLDARYDPATGYTGTLTIGDVTAAGLTLEFGDAISAFACDACGTVAVHGKRVVLVDAPRAHVVAHFQARVR